MKWNNILCWLLSYQGAVQPLHQAVGCGIRDLTAETLTFLSVHHLQGASQVFQKMESSQAAHERWSGRLAVKHTIGVVQRLGAWGEEQEGWLYQETTNPVIREVCFFFPSNLKSHFAEWLITNSIYKAALHREKPAAAKTTISGPKSSGSLGNKSKTGAECHFSSKT